MRITCTAENLGPEYAQNKKFGASVPEENVLDTPSAGCFIEADGELGIEAPAGAEYHEQPARFAAAIANAEPIKVIRATRPGELFDILQSKPSARL
jgi:hypothetical protein